LSPLPPALPPSLAPQWLTNGFSILSNPNRENSWVPLALIEGGAVIPGRSVAAWKRDPWEFRERIFDEVVVAAFWLKGFDWMNHLFDQLQRRLPGVKSLRHLDTGIDALTPKSFSALELTALERYASHATEILPILGMRGAKTLFSIVSSGLIIALGVPKLNQKLTELFLKRAGHRQERLMARSTEGDPTTKTTALATPKTSAITPTQGFGIVHGKTSSTTTSHTPATSPFKGFEAPIASSSSSPRFGAGNPQALAKGIQAFATGMERVNTDDYLKILTNDGFMVAGRTYSAATRPDTPKDKGRLEALEILVRDVGSNYFYLGAIPHTRWALGKLFKALNGSDIALDPAVGRLLNQHLLAHPVLQQALNGKQSLGLNTLQTVFNGHAALTNNAVLTEALHQQATHLASGSVPHQQFWTMVQADLQHGLGEAFGPWLKTLQQHLPPSAAITPKALETALKAIQQSSNKLLGVAVASVSPQQQANTVAIALKYAYRHSVGATPQQWLDNPVFKTASKGLSQAEQTLLQERLIHQATLGAQDQLNTTLRRMQSLGRGQLGAQHHAISALDVALKPLEKVVSHGVLLAQETPQALGHLKTALTHMGNALQHEASLAPAPLHALLGHYQTSLATLWPQVQGHTPGRLFTLHTTPSQVAQWVESLVSGGLRYDPAVRQAALKTVGLLAPDQRQYANETKIKALQQAMDHYWTMLETQVGKRLASVGQKPLSAQAFSQLLNHVWTTHNMLPRYVAHGLGIMAAMAGLGVLIPKLQYAVTTKLTGEYEHPALELLEQKYGLPVGRQHANTLVA
jgi:hypothetical protein